MSYRTNREKKLWRKQYCPSLPRTVYKHTKRTATMP